MYKRISLALLVIFSLTIAQPAFAQAESQEFFRETCKGDCEQPSPSPESGGDSNELIKYIRLTAPNGGEVWGRMAGTAAVTASEASTQGSAVETIRWDALSVGVKSVDIYYSLDMGDTLLLITQNYPDSGSYEWTLPNINNDSVVVVIRAFDKDRRLLSSDQSNAPFVLKNFVPDPTDESDNPAQYDYKLIDLTSPASVVAGEKVRVNVVIKNTGTATWYKYGSWPLHLGTTSAQDHVSQFADSSWLTSNRIELMESSVAPGEVGTFQFTFFANQNPGSYTEHFYPVAEHLTWLYGELITFKINIV